MKHYLLIAFFTLTACSHLPPAIQDPPAIDISYQQALANIGQFKNAPVRWGGTIVEVENEPSFSAIQILLYPLGSYGRPETDEPHQGRFVAKTPEFIDPAVYTKNMAITVAGTLDVFTKRTVGNKALQLPVVNLKQVHLWSEQDYTGGYGGYGNYGGFGYGRYGYYPYGGYYGYPYYWGRYYRPFIRHR